MCKFLQSSFPKIKYFSCIQEKERYKEPVRESLKALLAIGWTVEHSDVEVPSNNRNSTRRTSKANPVSIMCYLTFSSDGYRLPQSYNFFEILYIFTHSYFSLSLTHSLLTHSLSPSHTHTHTRALIPIQEPILTQCCTRDYDMTTYSLSLSLSLTHTHARAHAHIPIQEPILTQCCIRDYDVT